MVNCDTEPGISISEVLSVANRFHGKLIIFDVGFLFFFFLGSFLEGDLKPFFNSIRSATKVQQQN